LGPISNDDLGYFLLSIGIGKIGQSDLIDLFWGFLHIAHESACETQSYHWAHILDGRITSRAHLQRLIDETTAHFRTQISELCSTYPEVFARLVRVYPKPLSYVHLPYRKPEDPFGFELRLIGPEACNRGCNHCFVAATSRLPDMSLETFERWFGIFPLAKKVTITFGEPFYSNSLSSIIQKIFSSDDTITITIVTSGINFSSETECRNAEFIASLPAHLRQRITLDISISDYPHFHIPGLTKEQAARKVQQDTVAFAITNQIKFLFISFIPSGQLPEEVTLPALKSVCPGRDLTGLAIPSLGQDRHKKEISLGRSLDPNLDSTWLEYRRLYNNPDCIFSTQGSTIGLGITGDGAVIPGCCSAPSPFAELGHLDERDLLKKMARRVRAMHDANLEISKKRSSGASCLDCMALATRVRHEERARAVIGEANFAKLMAMREERRK
jgi:hypothetical protein